MNPDTAENPLPETPVALARRNPWPMRALLLLAVVAVVAFIALRRAPIAKTPTATARTVSVAKASLGDLDRTLVVPAEFRPYQEVDLHAKVPGFLESIRVDVGDRVEAGQLLASLEIPELLDDLSRSRVVEQRAAEEVRRAEAADAEAHAANERLVAVDRAQPKLVAQQELDVSTARARQSASALAAAKLQVEIARAETAKLETTARYAKITAPFGGVVTRRSADPGALIAAGTSSSQSPSLVRVSQIDRLRLGFPVSMSHVSRIAVGTPVEIRVTNRPKPILGKIARFTHRIDSATRTMEAEVDVENADLSLIPGMYASVAIRIEHRPAALSVPVQAVTRDRSTNVMVVGPDHVLATRPVTIGLETPDRIEILDGVREGESVIVGGSGDAKPGDIVEPRESKP